MITTVKRLLLILTFSWAGFAQINSSSNYILNETPGGLINGTNGVFTLANTPVAATDVSIYLNGVLQQNGLDFSLSGKVVSFTAAALPQTGDTLLANYYAVGSSAFVIGPGGINFNGQPVTGLSSANLSDVANLALNTLMNKNLVPDSDLKMGNAYWQSEIAVFRSYGADGGNAYVYSGLGTPSGTLYAMSASIPVTPGAAYTLSGYVDASAVSSGNPGWGATNASFSANYAQATVAPGFKGRVSLTFTIPAGVTAIVVICDTSNATVASGGKLVFSNPQLEIGAVPTTYKANLLDDVTGAYIVGSGGLNLNGQTVTGNATLSGSYMFTGPICPKGGFNPVERYAAPSSSDTATTSDHTVILNGITSESLPPSPYSGQLLYLINTSAGTPVVVAGNGHNIWQAGTSSATTTIPINSALILQYDGVSPTPIWRVVK